MIRRMDKPVDERGGMDWLGPEFLTWMWWRASVDPEFLRKDGSSVYVHVDEFLELKGERAAARKTTLRAGMPGASAEGKVALRNGKVVTAARLLLARGEEETALTLRAEDFDLSAVRLPATEINEPDERLGASLSAVRRLYEDLDFCFAAFLALRCTQRWDAELAKLRAWAGAPSDEERTLASSPS